MVNNYIDTINEIFESFGNIDSMQLEKLMGETQALIHELQEKLHSEDPELKEEVRLSAIEVKEALEAHMERLSKESGLSLTELEALGEAEEPITELDVLNKSF